MSEDKIRPNASEEVSEVTGLTQGHPVEMPDVNQKRGKMPWRVYLAHTLSSFGDNIWFFGGGLYMVEMDSQNMRLTAIYGLCLSATIVLLGAALGRWIDRTRRLTAARTCLLIQNLCVSLSAVLLSAYLFTHPTVQSETVTTNTCGATKTTSSRSLDNVWAYITVIAAIIFTSISKLASDGSGIILQKDWIVVIAGQDLDLLARMNSTLRSIELTTFMLCPFFVGLLFSFAGYEITGLIIAGWNLISVVFEYILLERIYKRYPELATKRNHIVDEQKPKRPRSSLPTRFAKGTRNMVSAWEIYMTHPVRNAGLGLALLYMTVLGFDNITYAYILDQCVPEFALGLIVAASALVGIMGSQAFKYVRRKVGLERTGLLGMFLLVSTSSAAVVSLFLPGSKWAPMFPVPGHSLTSVITLISGITAARFGLWIADLTITQILQEEVEEERRGVINGVQESLNSSLDLLKCALVIALPGYNTFGYLVLLSFASISLGWLMYALYSRKKRGHLFHFCRLGHVLDPEEIHQIPTGDPKTTPGTSDTPLV